MSENLLKTVGRRVTRKEAGNITRQIIRKAERARLEAATVEALYAYYDEEDENSEENEEIIKNKSS